MFVASITVLALAHALTTPWPSQAGELTVFYEPGPQGGPRCGGVLSGTFNVTRSQSGSQVNIMAVGYTIQLYQNDLMGGTDFVKATGGTGLGSRSLTPGGRIRTPFEIPVAADATGEGTVHAVFTYVANGAQYEVSGDTPVTISCGSTSSPSPDPGPSPLGPSAAPLGDPSATPPPAPSQPESECFLTKMAAGTPLEPLIARIRLLRDDMLENSATGRILVNAVSPAYYAIGRAIMPALEQFTVARAFARTLAAPLIALLAFTGWLVDLIPGQAELEFVLAEIVLLLGAVTLYVGLPLRVLTLRRAGPLRDGTR